MDIQNVSERSPGYGRLSSLFDEGTFVELSAYVRRKNSENEYEGVVCGYGSVKGRLVFAFAQDNDRLSGAVDEYHAKKIENLYKAALKNAAPVIGIFNSKGAVLSDGISSVSAYGRIMKAVSKASGVIPQIAVIEGVCAGCMAAVAEMFDFTVAVKDSALLYFASPFLVGEGHGKAEELERNGLVSIVKDNLSDALECAKKMLEILPDNAQSIAMFESDDDAGRASELSCNAYENIGSLTDLDSFVEVYAGYDASMITGLATVAGITVGVIANNSSVEGGAVTPIGAEKAARLISFCDSFQLPVLTLADSCGVKATKETDDARLASSVAKLAMAYASSSVAKVTLVTGGVYGGAAVVMGSKSMGADLVLALSDSCMGALTPEASVAFMENDLVGKEGSREELEAKWRSVNLSSVRAAEEGEVDDIISPAEARARICSALFMLSEAGSLCERKHTINPL